MALQANEERILVMAPAGRDAELVCTLLQGVGLLCASYSTLESFHSALDDGAGALLITTEALSPTMIQTLAQLIAEQPAWSDLSLVLLSQHNQNISITELHEKLGVNNAIALLERPVHA
jgi:hypothetical protein